MSSQFLPTMFQLLGIISNRFGSFARLQNRVGSGVRAKPIWADDEMRNSWWNDEFLHAFRKMKWWNFSFQKMKWWNDEFLQPFRKKQWWNDEVLLLSERRNDEVLMKKSNWKHNYKHSLKKAVTLKNIKEKHSGRPGKCQIIWARQILSARKRTLPFRVPKRPNPSHK